MNRSVIERIAGLLACTLPLAAPAGETLDTPHDCIISPNAVVEVAAAVPGLLEQMLIERSDEVAAGQVLARLEAGVEQASLELAEAWSSIESEIRIEETTGALERRQQQRISRLYASQAVALDDKDRAETEAALAALRLRYAREKRWIRELDARKAAAALERRVVRSPIDGIVVERMRNAGEYVENQPIARVAQLDPLRVETILPMELFGDVRAGMAAEVVAEHRPEVAHRAVVALVDQLGDAASGTFGVRLRLGNPERRIPAGLKCQVRFLPGLEEEAPTAGAGQSSTAAPEAPAALPAPPAADPVEAEPTPSGPLINAARQPHGTPGELLTRREGKTPPASLAAAFDPRWTLHRDSAAPAARLPVAVSPAAAESCTRLGPLDSAAGAEALATRLAAAGFETLVQSAETATPFGYIVVSPRVAGAFEASALAVRYRKAGVSDLLVMGDGPYAGRISLGIYAQRSAAERRSGGIESRGLAAEVLERTRSERRWWVHAQGAGEADLPSGVDAAAGRCSVPAQAGRDEHRSSGRTG